LLFLKRLSPDWDGGEADVCEVEWSKHWSDSGTIGAFFVVLIFEMFSGVALSLFRCVFFLWPRESRFARFSVLLIILENKDYTKMQKSGHY